MNNQIAFLGLGVMGFPMAGHLAATGYQVVVYNRTPARAQNWAKRYDGRIASTPGEAASGADLVFICVGNDEDVRQVVLGPEGALDQMQPDGILIDHTTTSALLARELYSAAAAKQVGFLDAPISGGQAGAENGALTVMVGGDQAVFDKAAPVIDAYAKSVKLLGPAGSGQLAKMVNQLCIAGVVQGLAEGLHFAKRAGLDGRAVVEVISKGAAQSWQMDNRYQTMIDGDFDFGFAVDWMRKDLGICLDEAERNGAKLELAALVDQYYAEIQEMGGSRWDTSSLIARLEKKD